MKVFATRFLEKMKPASEAEWEWNPVNKPPEIFASGMHTQTHQSTYAAEKDNRTDHDRPNEGFLIV
jgi:hypothetical protein